MLLHAPPAGAGEPALQRAVAAFLLDAAAAGDAPRAAVRDLVAAFAARYPALYAESPVKHVGDAIAEDA
jgi:hypothetical protein